MIVRTLEECKNSERAVNGGNWESVRMLLKDDKMGFSFHITTIFANTETPIWYKNHLESVYCISGDCVAGNSEVFKPLSAYVRASGLPTIIWGGLEP